MTTTQKLANARIALVEYEDDVRPLEVGDRVRVTGDRYLTPGLAAGGTGTVVRFEYKSVRVRMDSADTFVTNKNWGYPREDLELITPTPDPANAPQ